MAGIVFGLSEHGMLERFTELAEMLLEMNGEITGRVLKKLRAKAEELGIHQLDYEQSIWQTIQKNDGMGHNFITNDQFVSIAVSCPRCDEKLNEPTVSCPVCGWEFCFLFDGVSKEQAEAYWQNAKIADDVCKVKKFCKAAEKGDAQAQYNLGKAYYDGEGVVEDKVEAVKWYRKAADQGYGIAQYSLGYVYSNGKGLGKDKAEAVKWYRMAAEQGNVDAQFVLGYLYYSGEGVEADTDEAIKWYRKAADQGNKAALNSLKRLEV